MHIAIYFNSDKSSNNGCTSRRMERRDSGVQSLELLGQVRGLTQAYRFRVWLSISSAFDSWNDTYMWIYRLWVLSADCHVLSSQLHG